MARRFSVGVVAFRELCFTDLYGNVECMRVAQRRGTEEPRAVFRCRLRSIFRTVIISSALVCVGQSAEAGRRL